VFVFGTLLGPEATGPGLSRCLFVSGFLAASIMHGTVVSFWGVAGVWGVWCGVVV
jgi:hypothetical protein